MKIFRKKQRSYPPFLVFVQNPRLRPNITFFAEVMHKNWTMLRYISKHMFWGCWVRFCIFCEKIFINKVVMPLLLYFVQNLRCQILLLSQKLHLKFELCKVVYQNICFWGCWVHFYLKNVFFLNNSNNFVTKSMCLLIIPCKCKRQIMWTSWTYAWCCVLDDSHWYLS